MKKNLLLMIVLILAMSFLCVSCSGKDSTSIKPSGGYENAPALSDGYVPNHVRSEMGDVGPTSSEGSSVEKSTDGKTDSGTQRQDPPAGLITACAWDDNISYGDWNAMFAKGDDNTRAGKFSQFADNAWKLNTLNRVKVTVKNGENFVCGATVSFFGADQKEYKGVTNANGVAYIFLEEQEGTLTVKSGEGEGTAAFTAENRDLTVDLTNNANKDNVIKIMFVVDVTGSMGDELNYLTNEITDVIGRIARNDDQTRIDLALLFYRDNGDNEKFSYAEFKNVTDATLLAEQKQALAAQSATGGGDIPEALDEAVLMAVSKDWGEENSTKIIFHVFDAPSHEKEENITRCGQAVKIAAEKGIRYCPVLCSGADLLCEYIARQGALYTAGTFIYVTDHSGIGNEHYDPSIPNAVVEKLNDMMVRLVIGYHTGTFADPVWWNAK